MSFSSLISKKQYDGNDSTTVFSFPYLFQANADLTVIVTDVDGDDTLLVLDTDYSVADAGNPAGGAVTYPIAGDPLATGEVITIVREMDINQETDLSNHGAFFLSAIETALDKMIMVAQQLDEAFDRCVKTDVTDPEDPPSITEFNQAVDTVNELIAQITGNSFSAFRGESQSINDDTWTKVEFLETLFDENNDFSDSIFTPSIAGKYILTSGILYLSTLSNRTIISLGLYKNGVLYKVIKSQAPSTGGGGGGVPIAGATISVVVDSNGTTDYFEIFTHHNSGAVEALSGGTGELFFTGGLLP